jgi:hypothetical protein
MKVSFTLPPLYPGGQSPHYPQNRRLGGPHSWSGFFEEEYLLSLLEIQIQIYLYIQQSSEGTIIRTMGYGIRQITSNNIQYIK